MGAERFYTILVGNSTVTDQVSTRIYWDVAPLGTAAPYIVLTYVSGTPDDQIDGATAFDRLRAQVDCYTTGKASALALGALVRAAITPDHGYLISSNPAPFDPDSALYRDSADYELLEFDP